MWDALKGLKLRLETRLNGRADGSENGSVEVEYPSGEMGSSDVRSMGFEVEEMMGIGSFRGWPSFWLDSWEMDGV